MINELQKILLQVHEPNEYRLVSHDLKHSLYYIWKLEGVKLKDLKDYYSIQYD